MYDMIRLLADNQISYTTSGNKHCTKGRVNVHCPLCGVKENFHLGYHLEKDYWNCWSCGGHSTGDVLSILLGMPYRNVELLLKEYTTHDISRDEPATIQPQRVVLPPTAGPLQASHRNYLSQRGYDPDRVALRYNLKGTSHLGPYKFRIIAPIYRHYELVSYQGRDITGQSPLKYKACALKDELYPHKHSLYALDMAVGNAVVVVEGITDVWRLGPGAVGTFGTAFLAPQVNLLKNFEKRFLIFDSPDDDPAAILKSEQLGAMLDAFGGETVVIELDEGDPGNLSQDDADSLMKELGFSRNS